MRLATSSAIRGWMMAFSAARSPASAKTSAASALRSSEPSRRSIPGKRAAMSRSAGLPGSTTSRATRSASITGIPPAASILATVLLPEPMLPVNPQIRTRRVYTAPPP